LQPQDVLIYEVHVPAENPQQKQSVIEIEKQRKVVPEDESLKRSDKENPKCNCEAKIKFLEESIKEE